MLNHREVLEALLAGKVLRDVVDIDIIVFKGTDGKLYNEEEAPITELYLEGWELSPEVIEINGIEVLKGETVVPDRGTCLFLPVIHDPTYYHRIDWNGSCLHHDFF